MIDRDFTAEEPGARLIGDITYLRTGEGWLYLATVVDLATRMVVRWQTASHMRTSLIVEALQMTVTGGHVRAGAVFHSARGSHYTSTEFAAFARSGRYWLGRALGQERGSARIRVEATTIATTLAALQQDIVAGSALAAQTRRLADQTPDATANAAADFAAGIVAIAEGDLPRGIYYLGNAIEPLRVSADLARLVPALYWLGCAI